MQNPERKGKREHMSFRILKGNQRCALRCGVDEVCSEILYENGYCSKPKDRELGLKLEYGDHVTAIIVREAARSKNDR